MYYSFTIAQVNIPPMVVKSIREPFIREGRLVRNCIIISGRNVYEDDIIVPFFVDQLQPIIYDE